MNIFTDNLLNPALLFFFLGIVVHYIKSDLEIPPSSSRFISLYLLFAIGFKGGVALSHQALDQSLFYSIVFGLLSAISIPILIFFLIRKKLGVHNSGAIAAAYGSVSVVTMVTAFSFLEARHIVPPGHFTVILTLMEFPAIIVGLALINMHSSEERGLNNLGNAARHALTNGSVILIAGSMIIGMVCSDEQVVGIKPFTNDLFKGFLSIFLLDMGIASGRKLKAFFAYGWLPFCLAFLLPLFNGICFGLMSRMVTDDPASRFLFSVLAASASYIAVPAAMKINAPKADEGLYIPMALAVTFPVNLSIGFPVYYTLATG